MVSAPDLPLACPWPGHGLAYWQHRLATVAWIGSQVAVALVVRPVLHSVDKEGKIASPFLERIQRRLQPINWFSLAVLASSGLFQMSANSHYRGFRFPGQPNRLSLYRDAA